MASEEKEQALQDEANVHEVHEIGNRTFIVADVEPLDVTGLRTVLVGILLWVLGFVVLLVFFRAQLERDGHLWWLWTCVAGVVLGLAGGEHLRRRHQRLRARQREDGRTPDRV